MGNVEEVRIARRTGFYGVREAIDYARLAATQDKQTHTLGQVVHNEGVFAQLQVQGIRTVDRLDDVDSGAAVVIRAHGVTPEVMARAEKKGIEVIDGTCTWVIQEQKELKQLVALISQSTQPPWEFDRLEAFLVGRRDELIPSVAGTRRDRCGS